MFGMKQQLFLWVVSSIVWGTKYSSAVIARSLQRDDKDDDVASFVGSHQTVVRRSLAMTLPEAQKRVLLLWRKENLHLPLPPPRIESWGDEDTGVGFVLVRFPPWFHREGIVNYTSWEEPMDEKQNSGGTATTEKLVRKSVMFTYQVLNPSYWTWPVTNLVGRIVLQQQYVVPSDEMAVETSDQCTLEKNYVGSCELEWRVDWTPLWMPIPKWNQTFEWITTAIAQRAANGI